MSENEQTKEVIDKIKDAVEETASTTKYNFEDNKVDIEDIRKKYIDAVNIFCKNEGIEDADFDVEISVNEENKGHININITTENEQLAEALKSLGTIEGEETPEETKEE